MAALVAVVRLVKAGQHIVAGDDIYGGTSRLLLSVVPHQGIEVTNVDMTDIRFVLFWVGNNGAPPRLPMAANHICALQCTLHRCMSHVHVG